MVAKLPADAWNFDPITLDNDIGSFTSQLTIHTGDGGAPQSRLRIANCVSITFTEPMPCRWWRFWQRVLLGWTWEEAT